MAVRRDATKKPRLVCTSEVAQQLRMVASLVEIVPAPSDELLRRLTELGFAVCVLDAAGMETLQRSGSTEWQKLGTLIVNARTFTVVGHTSGHGASILFALQLNGAFVPLAS